MAEPEIDEAAAWAYASNHVATMERYYPIQHRTLGMQDTYNLARAALAWKARAEAAEAEVREAAMRATVEQASAKWWRDKCEAAEAEKAALMSEWGIETDESLTECFGRNALGWETRCLEAEAERDSLRRQIESVYKRRSE